MEAYLNFSQDNQWFEIWPELTLALGAVLVLTIDLFSKREIGRPSIAGKIAVFFQAFLLVFHLFDYLVWHHTFDRSVFNGSLLLGFKGDVMRSFFLLASLLVSILGQRYLQVNRLRIGDFIPLNHACYCGAYASVSE